jgi:N-acetylmuramoyl-L-alanine amidase
MRPFLAAGIALVLALVAATFAGATESKPKVTLEKSGKRAHVARVAYEAETETRAEVGFRVVGRTIDGRRRIVDTAAETQDSDAGRVRFEVPFRGARGACFPYLRCELTATVSVAPLTPPAPPATDPVPGEEIGADRASLGVKTGMPKIRERHIPFGAKRRSQMADYSKRHYGDREWRLEGPRGIVEHYTASSTLAPALNTFIQNRPDVEYHELPGVCAHYIIDKDGTILELVPTDIRCRHTVGLNHETVGIEHVGNSDSDVVGRPRVLRSSLALTSWLRCAYEIKRSNVIGHNESLGSPLYKELDPDFRGRTHGDMKPGTMNRYRPKLEGC